MKSKLLAFLFLCLSTSSIFSTSMYDGFKGHEWEFMEYMFIKRVEKDCNSTPKKIKNWTLGIGSYLFLFFLARKVYGWQINKKDWYQISEDLFPDVNDPKQIKKFHVEITQKYVGGLFSHGLSLPEGIMIFFLYNYWYKKTARYTVCVDFIKYWPEYKELAPSDMHEIFQDAYDKYWRKELHDNQIYQIYDVIEELINTKMKQKLFINPRKFN